MDVRNSRPVPIFFSGKIHSPPNRQSASVSDDYKSRQGALSDWSLVHLDCRLLMDTALNQSAHQHWSQLIWVTSIPAVIRKKPGTDKCVGKITSPTTAHETNCKCKEESQQTSCLIYSSAFCHTPRICNLILLLIYVISSVETRLDYLTEP